MSFETQIQPNSGAEEVVFADAVPTPAPSAPQDEPSLSADDDVCGDSSSGTSVCGYDADYDCEDNDTVCYDDTTVELTTGAERPHLPSFGYSGAVIDTNNNPISDKCLKKWIFIGSTVLSRWTDGLFYLGLIVQIDANANKCLIQFEDSSLYWIRFEDLHKQLSSGSVMADSDILCVVCRDGRSEAPNEIVICDVCNQGYHQKCHKPRIGDEILEPDIPWTCRLCVFALGTKEGGAEKTGIIGRALKQMKTELTYDLSSLHWDDSHQTNREQKYCYCGGNGNYYSKMLRCSSCMQWFHEACIQSLETPLLYGDHYYAFKCAVCGKGRESVKRITIKWSDMLGLVINNLALQHQKQFFELSADIVTFVQNYSNMFVMSEDITKLSERELEARILSVLKTNQNRFVNGREVRKKAAFWALRVPFPFETPLIFAPPFALQSPTQSSPTVPNKSPSPSETQPKSLPPSIPLIYGACRKGASKWPLTVSAFNQNKSIQSTGRSNSCSSSTGSNSCNASTLSFSSQSTRASKKSNKLKTNRTNGKPMGSKRKKMTNICKNSMKSSDVNSDISSDIEVISAPPIESLEAAIPVPKNFDGDNNPFAETEPNVLRRRLSNSSLTSRTKVAAITAPNKRISSKVEPNGSTNSAKGMTTPKMECFVDSPTKSTRTDNTFNILAQRVSTNGKVEYLLEWTTS